MQHKETQRKFMLKKKVNNNKSCIYVAFLHIHVVSEHFNIIIIPAHGPNFIPYNFLSSPGECTTLAAVMRSEAHQTNKHSKQVVQTDEKLVRQAVWDFS